MLSVIFILYSTIHILSMILSTIYYIYENKNPHYDIESLQIENDLLRKNITRLEKIIYEKKINSKQD